MTAFEQVVKKCYEEQGFNCCETIIHAANEYYQLGLHEEDMKMAAGFGSGMYSGGTCGALIAGVAVLSKLVIRTKAHDQLEELRPVISACCRRFKEKAGAVECAKVRPVFHTKETRCLNTVLMAAGVLEETVNQFHLA